MEKLKRIFAVFFCLLLAAGILGGCGKAASSSAPAPSASQSGSKPLKIVTTIFPEYDWVREILGDKADHAEVHMLLDNGVDLHSYQPTADDIIKISDCDLFIYVGGESDGWVEDALKEATNKNMKVINLLEVLGDKVKAEETVEGMEHEHETEEEHDHEHEEEKDEHVWLSLKNAEIICKKLTSELSALDKNGAAAYEKNFEAYKEKLSALDKDYSSAAANSKYKTLVFGDRFPFRYLADDYGLKYYAAFAGCSAETEASFETIIFLAGKIDELSLPAVCETESAKHKIAETVRDNTAKKNQKIVAFNSMQSVTVADMKNGVSYLAIMRENSEALTEALNG